MNEQMKQPKNSIVEPRDIQLNMVGTRPLYHKETLLPVLKALQEHPLFAAEYWGLDQRSNHPYDETRVLLVAEGESAPYVLQLKRKKRIKHTTLARLSDRPALVLKMSPKTPPRDWVYLFDLADSLTQAYQPEIAWVHIFSEIQPPLETDDERWQFLMDSGVTGSGLAYDDEGPGGLGMRTYLGPRLVNLVGRTRLLRTPVNVTELAWGGMRLDLVEQPWQASQSALQDAWRTAMTHLHPARVFSQYEMDESGNVFFRRSERFTSGRVS